jgi:hypothetical protein
VHLKALDALDGGAKARITDKLPENFNYLGLLAAMFPNATVIHCRRDLRDVAISCWMTDFRVIPYASDFHHLSRRFHDYVEIMNHWRKVLPIKIHDVQYEMVIADFEAVARRLISICGLDWHPDCLEFHRNARPIATASVTQVRQPIYKSSLDRWRNYEHELKDLFEMLPRTSELTEG